MPEKDALQNQNMECVVFEQEEETYERKQNCPADKELLNDITEEDYFDILCTQRTKIHNMSTEGKVSDVNSTQRLISMFFQEDSTDDSEVDIDYDISNKAAKSNSPTTSKSAVDSASLSCDGVISMENHNIENNSKQRTVVKNNLISVTAKSSVGFIRQEVSPEKPMRVGTFESPKRKVASMSSSPVTKNKSPSKKRMKSSTPIDGTADEVNMHGDISPSSYKTKSTLKEKENLPERPAFEEECIIVSEESKDSVCSDVKISSIEDRDIKLSGQNADCEINDINSSGRENVNIASQDHDENSFGEGKATWSPDNSQDVSGTDLFGTPSPNNSNNLYAHCLSEDTPKQQTTGEEDVINSPPSKRIRSLNFESESSKMEINRKNFNSYPSISFVENDANSYCQFESDRLSDKDLEKTFGVVDNMEGLDDDVVVLQSEFNSTQCKVSSDINNTLNNVVKNTTDMCYSSIGDRLSSRKTQEKEKYSDSASQEQDMDVVPSPKFNKSKDVTRKFRFTKRKYFSPEKLGNDLNIETPWESQNKIHHNSADDVLSKFYYTTLL